MLNVTHLSYDIIYRISEDVISVWNRSASNTEGVEKIRETVKRLLQIPSFVQVRRVASVHCWWRIFFGSDDLDGP